MQSAADLTKQEQQRRQRQLARLIQPEFNPQRVLVLGDQGLAAALQALQVEAWGLAESKHFLYMNELYHLFLLLSNHDYENSDSNSL